jgi:hypothetical protein
MEHNKQPHEKTICGIWSVDHVPNSRDLLLRREVVVLKPTESNGEELLSRWHGQEFVFHENGEMIDFYSAPCGNDGQLHHWLGKWKWNEEEHTLFLQVENCLETSPFGTLKPSESYKKGQEFYITEMTEQMMKLKPKDPGDQLWEYGTKANRSKRSKKVSLDALDRKR